MLGVATHPIAEVGHVVADKYRIIRVLGEGGMGVVYEAEHVRLGQRVALKMLKGEFKGAADVVARFEREARAAARLRGPNVANVTDVDTLADGTPFMVMEYLEGSDLSDELAAHGQLPIREAVDYVLQTCTAMAEAHQCRIIHRDLKPSNLFVAAQDGRRVIKVLDFGISKMVVEGDSAVTLTKLSLGTPLYMSPEQIRSAKHVDARTDIWSLGVILYELLAGDPPFIGENPTAVVAAISADIPPSLRAARPEVSKELERVVMKALRKNPAERYPTAEALASALLPFAGNHTSWTPPPRHSFDSIEPADSDVFDRVSLEQAPTVADPRGAAATTPGFDAASQNRNRRGAQWALMALLACGLLASAVWLVASPSRSAPAPEAPTRERARPASEPRARPPALNPDPKPPRAPEVAPKALSEPRAEQPTALSPHEPKAQPTAKKKKAAPKPLVKAAPHQTPTGILPPVAPPAKQPAPPPAPKVNPIHL